MKAGVIGLGDMGSGLAKNLIANGFETSGFDLSETRMVEFVKMGGVACSGPGDVGRHADAVYVMVMNGDQAKDVILGKDGLSSTMDQGGIIFLTATIKPSDARQIGTALEGSGLHFIDTPVSGGFPGAQGGTLTMMAAAPDELMAAAKPVMEAVSGVFENSMIVDGYDRPITLQARMEVHPHRITVDYAVTSGTSAFGINVPLTYTCAYTYMTDFKQLVKTMLYRTHPSMSGAGSRMQVHGVV